MPLYVFPHVLLNIYAKRIADDELNLCKPHTNLLTSMSEIFHVKGRCCLAYTLAV